MTVQKSEVKVLNPLNVVDQSKDVDRHFDGTFNVFRIEFLIKGKPLSEALRPIRQDTD